MKNKFLPLFLSNGVVWIFKILLNCSFISIGRLYKSVHNFRSLLVSVKFYGHDLPFSLFLIVLNNFRRCCIFPVRVYINSFRRKIAALFLNRSLVVDHTSLIKVKRFLAQRCLFTIWAISDHRTIVFYKSISRRCYPEDNQQAS